MENFMSLVRTDAMIPFQLTPLFLFLAGSMIAVAYFSTGIVADYCSKRWNGNALKARFICEVITLGVTLTSLVLYGISMTTLQAIIYCEVCLFSSYSDFKARELDDSAHCIILATALAGRSIYDISAMLFAALLIGGIALLVGVISKGGGIGGADIKFSAVSAMVLGFQRSSLGMVVGLLIAVIITSIKNKKTGKKDGFPLVPYLAIGFMGSFFLP